MFPGFNRLKTLKQVAHICPKTTKARNYKASGAFTFMQEYSISTKYGLNAGGAGCF